MGLLIFVRVLAPIVLLLTATDLLRSGARGARLPYEKYCGCGFSRGPDHTHVLALRQRPCREVRPAFTRQRTRNPTRSCARLRPTFHRGAHCTACNSYRETWGGDVRSEEHTSELQSLA